MSFQVWLMVGVTALVVVPLLAFIVLSLILNKKEPNAPPVWTGGLPIIHHFLEFIQAPVECIKNGYMAKGSVFTMKIMGHNLTFLIGPKAQTPFFQARDEELSQNEPYKFMTPIFGRGVVFDAPLEVKTQQLKFVAGALKPGALKTYVPKIMAEAETFFNAWGDSGEIDLLEAMAHLTIRTASSCLLGPEVRGHLFDSVSLLLKDLDEGINPMSIFFPNLPLPSFRKRDAARVKIGELFSAVIRARRERGVKEEDMLQAFMDATYRDGSTCSDYQITGLLLGVLFAGQHTSSITTTWTVLNLIHHPDHLRRMLSESTSVLGPDFNSHDGFNFDNISKLDHLHRSVKESLRQYPPLIMLMRQVHEPMQVEGYTIPNGHYVIASPAVAMNLPDTAKDAVFSNPEKFDPDRFDKERLEDKKFAPLIGYCAFGSGPHACLGEQFGFLQVKSIVSYILRHFDIEPISSTMPEPNYKAMVVGPLRPGTMVRYRRKKIVTAN